MEHSVSKLIQWYVTQQAKKVTYSMANRLGPNSFDCSSAGYFALIAAGFFPASTRIGNTDSMFNDFERNGWTKIKPNAQGNYNTKAGDSVIWGTRGASAGSLGHFMVFANPNDVIHCNSYYNGIHINNYDDLAEANGWPEATFYRYTGAAYTPPSIKGSPTDQVLEIGSTIKFTQSYLAGDVQMVGGIWQVRSQKLCPKGFTWDDNGIPAQPLVEVDALGYATPDQNLDVGSLFKLPGKFTVLDLGETNGVWMALISSNGLKFWVDVATATEIKSTDAGTPTPGKKPATPTKPSAPTPAPEPAKPAEPTPPKQTQPAPSAPAAPPNTKPVEDKPAGPAPGDATPAPIPAEKPVQQPSNNSQKEITKMAFSENEQKKLQASSDEAQKIAAAVAGSDVAKEIVSGISKSTKMKVYIVGDSLLGLGALTPQIVILFTTHEPFVVATTLSSLFATAGLFLLTMFGIYKSNS